MKAALPVSSDASSSRSIPSPTHRTLLVGSADRSSGISRSRPQKLPTTGAHRHSGDGPGPAPMRAFLLLPPLYRSSWDGESDWLTRILACDYSLLNSSTLALRSS